MVIAKDEDSQQLERVYTSGSLPSFKDECIDPFALPYDKVKKFNGLAKDFVKKANQRMTRQANSPTFSIQVDRNSGSTRLEPEALLGYNYLDCVVPKENLEYLARLFDISAANHSAINAKVDNIVGLGYDWIESSQTKAAKRKLRSDSGMNKLDAALAKAKQELQSWLDDLNQEDTFDEILRKVWRDYESTGNAYIEIGRDKKGRIGYIGHVSSIHVRIRASRDGFIQIIGNEAVYFRNFGQDTVNPIGGDDNPNELIHFKKYSPTSSYYGVPDIIPALSALAGNEFAAKYNLDYFENKAIPRYVIVAKGGRLSPASVKQLVEFFETGLRGKHHRSIYVPVPDENTEIKFEAIEASTQDSSFNEYTEANHATIFMAHRTPKTRAGVLGAGSGGLAASRDADKIFKESVCRPEQAIIEKKLNRLFKEITDMFVFKLNELSLTDEDQQSQINERYVKMQVKVPDEIRTALSLPPRPDGKGGEPWQASAQQNADQKAQQQQSRARDSARSAGSSDKVGEGRNEQGAGRKTP